jgi:HEPN domain-containing protein
MKYYGRGRSCMSTEGKNRLIADWFKFAEEDLSAARELAGRGYYHHQACLLCQQSSEKYLKAYLLSQGWKLVVTHELSPLVGECCACDETFQQLYPPCELLNKYIVTGRYPGDLPFESTTCEDAGKALEAASAIQKFVLAKQRDAAQ